MISVSTMRPFTRCLMTIGMIPTSYLVSMTYEEQLLWLCNYLEKEVIPALNNNAEALKEVQDLYVELKKYVDDYFSNLDVQEEINNKLDEMATDGTLDRIINQEIFGDLQKDVSNLKERMTNVEQNESSLSENVNQLLLGQIDEEIVMIGDSYLAGQSLSSPSTQNFGYLLMQKLGMNSSNFHIWAEGGSSFVITGNQGHTWQTLIASNLETLSDPSKVTKVIFAGGYNDVNASTAAQIETAMSGAITVAKSSFPNAKIYIALIANNGATTTEGANARNTLKNRVYNVYSKCTNFGAIFMDKGQLPLQDYSLFETSPVKVHPNENGHIELANYFFEALKFGTIDYRRDNNAFNATIPSGMSGSLLFAEKLFNNKMILKMQCNLTLSENLVVGFGTLNLGEQTSFKFLRNNNYPVGVKSSWFTIGASDSSNVPVPLNARAYINANNEFVLEYYNTGINKNRIVSAEWIETIFDVQNI